MRSLMILCLGEQFCVMKKGKAGGRATGAQHRSAPTDVMGQAGLTHGNLEFTKLRKSVSHSSVVGNLWSFYGRWRL